MRSALTRLSIIITDVALFTPTNIEQEKEKFFKNTSYNPQFRYKSPDFPLLEFRKSLEKYLQEPQDDEERINELVQERVRELFLWLDLHENLGTELFSDISQKLYGKPSLRVVEQAKALLASTKIESVPERKLSGKEVVNYFVKALEEEGLEWEVVLKEELLNRVHLIKGKELRIRPDATFNEQDIQKLIVHEIKTHARRFKNGLQQENPVFETGTAHFLETEEGLATFNEDQAGLLPVRVKRNLAARVIAVQKALSGSFSEVFFEVQPLVGKEKAFELAVNVKRGLTDTSKPGGFTKAHIYYSGWQKIQALPEEDIKYLYVGKISYVHLPLIKELVKEGKVKLI